MKTPLATAAERWSLTTSGTRPHPGLSAPRAWAFLLALAYPLLVHGQLTLVAPDTTPLVFAGPGRPIPVTFHNASDADLTLTLRTKLLQASSATTMPVGEPRTWKPLRVLAGQTVLETATLDYPAVKAPTRFIVQWLDGDDQVRGTTDVVVYPPNLLKNLQPLLGEKPLGLFDPQHQLKPLLTSAKVGYDDFQEAGWETFAGRLALIGPFADRTQVPLGLDTKVKALAGRGVAVVWMQPPSGPWPKLEPALYGVRLGPGQVVVVPAKTVSALPENPLSQLNLVRLAQWALRPDRLELPQLTP